MNLAKGIKLEKEQRELISTLVEAHRNFSGLDREKFYFLPQAFTDNNIYIAHPGLPDGQIPANPRDVDVLIRYGLLYVTHEQGGGKAFDISPTGFGYYEKLKKQIQKPIKKVINEVKTYIDSDIFQQKHLIAYQKWHEAEKLLWEADSEQKLTTIGHLCRESIQAFVSSLVTQHNPPDVDENESHDINRIKAVISQHANQFGKTEKSFLNSLIDYWKSISELVQRQEHGAQREKESLIWEDGRRVIFQTIIVMYEVDRALSRK